MSEKIPFPIIMIEAVKTLRGQYENGNSAGHGMCLLCEAASEIRKIPGAPRADQNTTTVRKDMCMYCPHVRIDNRHCISVIVGTKFGFNTLRCRSKAYIDAHFEPDEAQVAERERQAHIDRLTRWLDVMVPVETENQHKEPEQ